MIAGVKTVAAIFRRPVGDSQDFTIELTRTADGSYSAEHLLEPGPWVVDLAARAGDRTIFHQAERIIIGEGGK